MKKKKKNPVQEGLLNLQKERDHKLQTSSKSKTNAPDKCKEVFVSNYRMLSKNSKCQNVKQVKVS